MKLLVPLLIVFAAACSDGQSADQSMADARQHSIQPQAKIPLIGRVNDFADIISEKHEAALWKRLTRFEESTSHQLVVVTVNSLDGQDISDYTRDLANAWGIGRKDYNDGVVILIAPNERQVRIAVGYGLEQALPKSLCKRIIDEQMVPRFREGKLELGIETGVSTLIEKLTPQR
ncbi:MAG: TPM domain-containing protein [Alphaproteobacteria bacterium]|nr:TPM domain-containing protein [Alphaproteobacteria bacterium]MBU0795110.1 TPM domain-containing protein [Alphaproteobacteria bacterium]MBU0874574.1 TPM domain-containing protein [Alphaproteobacteria bacterium]MBU1769887.1 TPM domain-containing protein [Alphaproteobacteria bacterium]